MKVFNTDIGNKVVIMLNEKDDIGVNECVIFQVVAPASTYSCMQTLENKFTKIYSPTHETRT